MFVLIGKILSTLVRRLFCLIKEPWDAVEGGHEQVGDGEVEQEVVGDAPHGLVRQDDPQDQCVPQYRDYNDDREEKSPNDLLQTPREVFLKPEPRV